MARRKNQAILSFEKLGRQRAWGLYMWDDIIRVDSRLKGKAKLEIMIHEYFHHLWPDMEEKEIGLKAEKLSEFLYKNGVRIVEEGNESVSQMENRLLNTPKRKNGKK